MYSVAIGYWVYEQPGSSGLEGIMSAISMFVTMVLSPFSGSKDYGPEGTQKTSLPVRAGNKVSGILSEKPRLSNRYKRDFFLFFKMLSAIVRYGGVNDVSASL